MKTGWSEWEGPGSHNKQLWIDTKPSDDGWATYSLCNRRKVAKIVSRPDDRKVRILSVNQTLRRDAEWTYGEIRWIMRFQNQAIASEMTLLQS